MDEKDFEKKIKGATGIRLLNNASHPGGINGQPANPLKVVYKSLSLYGLTQNNLKGLNAPGDFYIITDTRKKTRKDLEDTALLKKYDIKHLTGEELQKLQNDDPLLYEQIKSDLAAKAPIKQALTNEDLMQEVDKMLKDWEK